VLLLEHAYNIIILDNLSNSSDDVIGKIEQIAITPPVASDIPLDEGKQKKASFVEGSG